MIKLTEPNLTNVIGKYKDVYKYGVCIVSLEYLYVHKGIVSALKNLTENTSIGYYAVSINLPNLYEDSEEGDEEFYFEEGVEFVYDICSQIISNQEFIMLIDEFLAIHNGEPLADKCKEFVPLLKSIYMTNK